MSTFLHYVRCKDALLDCSAPGGERCESLTGVDEIVLAVPLRGGTLHKTIEASEHLDDMSRIKDS